MKEKMKCQMKKEAKLMVKKDWHRPTGIESRTRNKSTQTERYEHEATHAPFGDWCARCMMGRFRTHHHVTKQKTEDQSRRPTTAMDCYLINMKSVVNAETLSEGSVTCIAEKEDRHQNIMSSVALNRGVEEPWTIERVTKFIDLLGYRDITLKSDTEPSEIV